MILAGHDDEEQRDALLKAIRRDVSDRPGDLALVQMALFETWRESNAGRENLLEAYSRVGGVAGALAHAAEEVRQKKLSEDEGKLLEPVLARASRWNSGPCSNAMMRYFAPGMVTAITMRD